MRHRQPPPVGYFKSERFRSGLFASAAIIAAVPAIASAQTTPNLVRTAAAADPADSGASAKVQEVIVTAQKRAENLQSVPISAQVVAGAALTSHNITSLETVSQTMPGVNVTTGGGSQGDTLVVRGVGYNRDAAVLNQSVATFEDDIYHGRSRSSYATFLDLDHIEVLKGPQSTYFGNNAIAGALNIITKKPGDQSEGYARALYGMYGQYAFEAAATLPVNDKLSIRLAGLASGGDGWIKNTTTGGRAPREGNVAGRLTVSYRPMDDLDVLLKIEGGHDVTLGTGYGPTQLINCPPAAPFTPANVGVAGVCATALAQNLPIGLDNNQNSGIPGQGQWLQTFEDVLTVNYHKWGHTFTSVTGYSSFRFQNKIDSNSSATYQVTQDVPEKFDQFSQEFRVASPTGQTIEYMLGAYFQTDRIGQSPVVNQPAANALGLARGVPAQYLPVSFTTPFTQNEDVYSLFGSMSWNVTDSLKLNAGLREIWVSKSMFSYRQYGTSSQVFGGFTPVPAAVNALWSFLLGPPGSENLHLSENSLMPSAGLQYKFSRNAMAYFTYSQGFLAGGFNYGSLAGNPFPQFGPEHATSYEIGVKSKWFDNRLLINLDAFWSQYNDLQVSEVVVDPTTGAATQTILNAANSLSRGVEFEGQWAVSSRFRLVADASYIDSHYINFPNGVPSALQTLCRGNYVLPYCSIYPKPVAPYANLSGQQLPYAPRWSGSVTASYTMPLPDEYKATTSVTPYLSSSYPTISDPFVRRVDSYVRLDASFTLTSPGDRWSLDIIGKNLTDRSIITFAQIYFAAKEEPRNVAVQLRYKW